MRSITNKQKDLILEIYNTFSNHGDLSQTDHEVNPGLDKSSRENYLYFLMSCTINFQRNSHALWKASLNTWNDKKTNYLFFPEVVVKTKFEKIQKDMIKHKLALQKNKHPDIWIKISTTLNKYYNNDPREVLKECNFEIAKIIPMLQKEKKYIFPYLGGLKLSNYTMAILNWYTDANFKDMYNLSIIPDTHIIKSSVKIGLVSENATPKQVENAWRPILKELDITPQAMHSSLWHWSRSGFKTRGY